MKTQPSVWRERGPRCGARPCLAGLLLVLALAGCKQEVFTKLTEADANEMLGVLLLADIEAGKASPDGKSWAVSVDSEQLGQALAVLKENGLPAPRTQNLGELFKKDGLISTPTEERVRFKFGVEQQLAATFLKIDGVVKAEVIVVLPNNDPLAEHMKPSSASVFIKYLPTASVANLTPMVKNLVVRGVEGLSYENVNVMLVEASVVPKVNAARDPARNKGSMLAGVLVGILSTLLLVIGAFFGARLLARLKPNLMPAALRPWLGAAPAAPAPATTGAGP
jgi:type III secretion protein J